MEWSYVDTLITISVKFVDKLADVCNSDGPWNMAKLSQFITSCMCCAQRSRPISRCVRLSAPRGCHSCTTVPIGLLLLPLSSPLCSSSFIPSLSAINIPLRQSHALLPASLFFPLPALTRSYTRLVVINKWK